MLSAAENDYLCRVGPGTPMGNLMREYWIPALMSSELAEPDSPPVRVRLLGENLIAFRASSGVVGLVANACPHRGASLFFGRNEEDGLRCVYHGWKFDTTGQCIDMPSEPAESNFRSKVRATAYPTSERNGVVFAYMGARAVPPPLPDLEPNMQPDGQFQVQKVMRDCNWVQGLEGDIDTSHLAFLHLGAVRPETARPGSMDYYTVKDKAPRYSVIDTEFGTSYGAYRPAEEDTTYWRVAHFLFPFYTMIPTGTLGIQILVRIWVPIDDEHMMFWSLSVPRSRGFGQGAAGNIPAGADGRGNNQPAAAARGGGGGFGFEFLPDTADWLGKFRLTQRRENDYLIDRESQKSTTYTGIAGIHTQDQAITESMGQVVARQNEHLGTSDAMIIRTRRRLIEAARALATDGTMPPGVDDPSVYRYRSGGVILPRNADWLEATRELRQAFVEHAPDAISAGGAGA